MRVSRNALTTAAVLFGALASGGCPPGSITPADPNACGTVLDYLRQPTAAAAIPVDSGAEGGHLWATVDRTNTEHQLNVDVVPQTGWPVANDTRGLAFSMYVKRPDTFGQDPTAMTTVSYVMEYTLPVARCDSTVSWDADLSITLPHGVCKADEGTPATCRDKRLSAKFDLFSVNDPAGTMSLSATGGGARAQLEQGIDDALSSADTRSQGLTLVWNSSRRWRKARTFRGSFNVASGVRAHVYVGVSGQLYLADSFGWICLQKCTTAPTDKRMDAGLFQIESSNGGVGIVMTKR